MEPMTYVLFPSPFGAIGIVWRGAGSEGQIHRVALTSPRAGAEELIRADFAAAVGPDRAPAPSIRDLIARMQSLLEGEPVELPLSRLAFDICSPFQHRVLLAEHAIPRGAVSSYGRIAGHLGLPMGGRAVGHALARNPFPLFIPCHRAIRADGKLGGYQGGVAMKRALLAFEGVGSNTKGHIVNAPMWY